MTQPDLLPRRPSLNPHQARNPIERYVDDTYESLTSPATITAHLVTHTARFAKQRLIDRRADPGKSYLDWEVADPAQAPIETVRRIRDDIDRRVRDLLADLLHD